MGSDEVLVSEAASELKMSHVSVWRHIRDKRLPARRLGPIWLIKRTDLDAFKAKDRPRGRPRKQTPPA
jgi:excisionase family DNA binding protein